MARNTTSLRESGGLAQRHLGELALAHLQYISGAGVEPQRLVAHLLAVHADSALLDHAKRVRGRGADARRLQDLGDRPALRGNLDHLLFEVGGNPAMAEARVEILQRGLCGAAIVESRHDFLREPDLDVAPVAAALARPLPSPALRH